METINLFVVELEKKINDTITTDSGLELFIDTRFEGNVEVGGLLLCENSTDYVESRKQAHADMNKSQIESVDNNYLRQSDARMPVLRPERSTTKT